MATPDQIEPATFEEKVKFAEELIAKKLAGAKNPFVCFSGGKRSTVLLHMVKKLSGGKVSAVFIDTGVQFDNVVHYTDKMGRLWNLNLVVERPDDNIVPAIDRDECCKRLICGPLMTAAAKNGMDLLFIGLHKDKNNGLSRELSCLGDAAAYPLWHFADDDAREYVKKYHLPACSLYEKGYLAVDCAPCSLQGAPANVEDEELMREKLKKLGYV